MIEPITITHATEDNSQELWRLAALDDRSAPKGPALLAYVDGRAVADPFHRTAEIVEILKFQARKEVAA